MSVRVLKGDLFESGLPAIGHGCNTKGSMGAGIAKEFRRRWPAMYEEYRRRCLAGTFGLGDVFVWETMPVIFNLGTQPRPRPSATLEAIETAVSSMLEIAERRSIPAVGLPWIGAGLGGLNWADVYETLNAVAARGTPELVIFEL